MTVMANQHRERQQHDRCYQAAAPPTILFQDLLLEAIEARFEARALVLQRSLQRAQQEFQAGERSSAKLISAAREVFASEPAVRLDYFEIVDPDTLEDVPDVTGGALVAVAAFVGATRLIDNILL